MMVGGDNSLVTPRHKDFYTLIEEYNIIFIYFLDK